MDGNPRLRRMAQRTRRRMPAAQRREELLSAAEEVFGRRGYHGASLEEIAQAAGVSKALIYEHFDSKRDLHGALLERHVGAIFARLQANAEAGTAGEERLRGGIDAFLRFVEEHRDAWRFLFRDAADPEVADRVAAVQAQAVGVIAALIEADPEGPTDPLHVQIHAQLLSGAVQSLASWWHEHQDVPREVLLDRAVDFCWVGIERMRERRRAGA
jgi:AcrR family transcriptional regulator